MTAKLQGVYELQEGQYKNFSTDLRLTLKRRVKPSATKPPFYLVQEASGGPQIYLSSLYPTQTPQSLSGPLRAFRIDDREGNWYRVTFTEDFQRMQIQKNPPKTPKKHKPRDLSQELKDWVNSASSIINAEFVGKNPTLLNPYPDPFDPYPDQVTLQETPDRSGRKEGGPDLW